MSTAAKDAARADARAEARRGELAAALKRRGLLEQDFFQFTNWVLAFSYEESPGRPSGHQFKCRIGKFHAPCTVFTKETISQGFLPFGAPSDRYHRCCHPLCSDECRRIFKVEDAAIVAAAMAWLPPPDVQVPPLFPPPAKVFHYRRVSSSDQIRVSSS